ncbi:MAG: virulence protein RhuM/Fic/DOC family protein [Candidatus Omnitrophota bacterium]
MNNKETNSKGEIILYQAKDGKVAIEVNFEQDTVWLNLNQMTVLFARDKSVISRHLHNIFKTNELEQSSVVANFATTAADGKEYRVDYYNLDAIISVGYRVNSKRGTQFRIWATDILRKHLLQGYTLNERLLRQQKHKFESLQKAIRLMQNVKAKKTLEYKEIAGLLDVIGDYSYALELLDDYDNKKLKISRISSEGKFKLNYQEAVKVVEQLKKGLHCSGFFGKERDSSFKSSIASIYQTFDGKDLYPSVEEKAANLLYFIVKNHSFIDGNKRIAASIFLWFLDKNRLLYKEGGVKRIADNALVALTLMMAESDPAERDIIVTLVVNLINKNN